MTDFVTSILTQSKKVCQSIQNNFHFQGNFSIVSFSQGGLIGRYIIEECEMKGRVKKYIAIGTPQRGVGKIPLCFTGIVCYGLQKISSFLIYSSIIQNHVGPAGYYVDVFDKESYIVEKTKAKPTPLIIKEDIILPRSHNRKVSCDLTLPKVTIETFSTVANKPNIVKKDNHINTSTFGTNYNQYKYIFEDPVSFKYRSRRSNSKTTKHIKNNLLYRITTDNPIQDISELTSLKK